MTFDVEAGRRVIREAEEVADDVAPGAVHPVIDALSASLDEITRLTNMLHAVHMALQCPKLRREPQPEEPRT